MVAKNLVYHSKNSTASIQQGAEKKGIWTLQPASG
jgi:hypothetical protein